jgi:adenine-specific DNA-methyltransferase
MSKSKILSPKTVEAIKHDEANRKNIPTAEYQSMVAEEEGEYKVAFERRNKDLDPQLVWRTRGFKRPSSVYLL